MSFQRGSQHTGKAPASAKVMRIWLAHLAVFGIVQVALAVTGYSWPLAFVRDTVPENPHLLMNISRIWLIVFAIDTVWSGWKILGGRRSRREREFS